MSKVMTISTPCFFVRSHISHTLWSHSGGTVCYLRSNTTGHTVALCDHLPLCVTILWVCALCVTKSHRSHKKFRMCYQCVTLTCIIYGSHTSDTRMVSQPLSHTLVCSVTYSATCCVTFCAHWVRPSLFFYIQVKSQNWINDVMINGCGHID